jgi:K+-sensing histidine kinase KdpD
LSWVIENESRAGKLTDTFPGSKFLCIPIGTNPVKGSELEMLLFPNELEAATFLL